MRNEKKVDERNSHEALDDPLRGTLDCAREDVVMSKMCLDHPTKFQSPFARFCTKCGKELIQEPILVCERCKERISDSDEYCGNCGARIKATRDGEKSA
jgi:Double zinc ribbon